MFHRLASFGWRYRVWFFGALCVMTLLWSALAPQFNAGFPDADSYYHGQIAQMMINQRGFVHDYPWLTFMSWHDQFIDGHLGYHIWLIPFVGLWGLTLGMKISAAAGAILAIGVLYWGLRRLNPAWALWLTWLAILTNQFMFRLSLPRAPAVAICLLIPFIFAVVERRWRLVGLLSFIFAFAYHSWPVLSVVVVIGLISELLTRRHQPRVNLWPLLGWHALGITASYLINPYFPINIRFAWLDIFQIGLLNDRQAIRVGGEWYPTNDQAFVQAVIWPTLLIATVCLVIVLARRFKQRQLIEITSSQQRPRLFFGLLTTLFFVLAAGSQRYFEYLIPSILLLTAALLPIIKPFITRLRLELGRDAMGRFVIGLTCLALIFGPLATNLRDLTELRTTNDQNAVVVQPGLNALAKQIAPGSVVFHNRWDDGPTFAVAEPRLRYLIGLDPTFFAAYDRTAFETWRRICQNKSVNLATDLRSLGAQGVVIRSIGREQAETMPLTTHISALPNSERVYTSTNLVAFILH